MLGVSPDSVADVKRFHGKQGLNFTLLADEDHAVAEAYGVWVQKSMYGRTYLGNERTTFVLDEEGKVTDEGFGRVGYLDVPGIGELGLYEPRHPTPR